jgi:hypothetical protein
VGEYICAAPGIWTARRASHLEEIGEFLRGKTEKSQEVIAYLPGLVTTLAWCMLYNVWAQLARCFLSVDGMRIERQ